MTLHYTLANSPFGQAIIGVSERGLCCVLLGEHEPQLVASLTAEFPAEQRVRDDAALRDTAAAVERVLKGAENECDLALDLRGTDFQRRVWHALREIPRGSTATYTQIAESIGSPRAVRAVASACAANHIAVLVPCHRVVRSDGSLGGYRWGIERKRMLLDSERVASAPLVP
jgi:AraC family transcriptional regulator of adaptative response/methylated-DNA-[protein]-cysteine methyltransferase